jgi:hypothetical protein
MWWVGCGELTRISKIKDAYKSSVGYTEGKRTLGKLKRRGKDNVKMDHKEI